MAAILGGLFKHGKHAARTAHFRPNYDWVYHHDAPNQGTNETKPTHAQNDRIQHQTRRGERRPTPNAKDQNQHQSRINIVDKRNHRHTERPKPTPNANQRQGQTKPPRNSRSQRRHIDILFSVLFFTLLGQYSCFKRKLNLYIRPFQRTMLACAVPAISFGDGKRTALMLHCKCT